MKKLLITTLLLLCPSIVFASFPTTGILDTFNRSNEGPPMTGWTDITNGFKVVSNTAQWSTDSSLSYWNGANFGPDVEAYVTISVLGGSTDNDFVAVRHNTASNNYYKVNYLKNASSPDTITIRRVDAGVDTILATYSSTTVSAGDGIGIKAVGSSICAEYQSGSGAYTELGCVNDATYASAGRISMRQASHAGAAFDNFGGGTVNTGNFFQLF